MIILPCLLTALLSHTRVHNDDADETATAVLYELWPYPPISQVDDALNGGDALNNDDDCPGTFLRSNAASGWIGQVPRRPRLLDAGTGTGEDCFALASELMELERLGAVDTFELICMDVSSAALQLARRRFDHRAIPKVYWPRFVHGSFTDAALLRTLGPFDYILAEGSIHHNDNPAAALRLLAASLRDRWSVLRGFVYWEMGSRAITDVARAFRLLQDARGLTTPAQRLAPSEISRLRGYLRTLPETAWYQRSQAASGLRHDLDAMSNATLADLFLHPVEHQFSAADVRAMAAESGLFVLRWLPHGTMLFECRHRQAFLSGDYAARQQTANDTEAMQTLGEQVDAQMSEEQREAFIETHFGGGNMHLSFLLASAAQTESERSTRRRWEHETALESASLSGLTPIMLHRQPCAVHRFLTRLWARLALPDGAMPQACTAAALAGADVASTVEELWRNAWGSIASHWYDDGSIDAQLADNTWPLWAAQLTLPELCVATHVDGRTPWGRIHEVLTPHGAPSHALTPWEALHNAAVQLVLVAQCEVPVVNINYTTFAALEGEAMEAKGEAMDAMVVEVDASAAVRPH